MKAAPWLVVLAVTPAACGGERDHRSAVRDGRAAQGRDAAPADAAPRAINIESMTMGMVRVPAGEFVQGCEVGKDPACYPCGKGGWSCNNPPSKIHLDEFYIDRTEVTVSEYAGCVEDGRCTEPTMGDRCKAEHFNWDKPDRRDHPVNCITTNQAAAFCDYRGKHLPTERQFEKAARGTDGRTYPWGSETPTCAHAILMSPHEKAGCGRDSTWPVGSTTKGASPYGAVDLIGNVMELVTWVPSGPADPGMPDFDKRVLVHSVGGSAWYDRDFAYPWGVTGLDAEHPTESIGFRCAFTPSFVP